MAWRLPTYGGPSLRSGFQKEQLLKYSVPLLTNIKTTLEMIKWEHSIFALPFALCAAMLAAGGMPTAAKLGWIVLCMVSARSAAMAFNRVADARIDAANPRTAMRHSRRYPLTEICHDLCDCGLRAFCFGSG